MGDATSISWTDATWNPIRGCRRTAPAGSKQSGCGDTTGGGCYAERQAARFAGPGGAYEGLITLTANGPRWSGKTKFVAEHLADPLRWTRPRRIFVDSMSDLFYEGFTNEQIAAVFGVMAAAPQHTFQVLTKRAKRMREWFAWLEIEAGRARDAAIVHYEDTRDMQVRTCVAWLDTHHVERGHIAFPTWPLPNVWLGVSVENQAAADERIPDLLETPAAVRFLSCEPLLEHVTLAGEHDDSWLSRLSWVIVGCESGPGARTCNVEWLRSLRDQCAAARVPMFLKQAEQLMVDGRDVVVDGTGSRCKARCVIELPYLDGVQHAAFPEVSR